jgi:hypothetical protein
MGFTGDVPEQLVVAIELTLAPRNPSLLEESRRLARNDEVRCGRFDVIAAN